MVFNGGDINTLASSIAAIYKDTLSNFRFRIRIGGSAQQLQNPLVADRIRAMLLAGVRAAYLWRAAGGSRWQLVFRRNRLLREAQQILNTEIPR
jgi:high frequency lysogenization protein